MSFYFRRRLIIDYLTGIIVVATIWFGSDDHLGTFRWLDADGWQTVMLDLAGTAASLLGLVLAAGTFLIGLVQRSRYDLLRKSKGWLGFHELFKSCIWRLFFLMTLTIIASLVHHDISKGASLIIAFQSVVSFASLAALLWAMLAIMAVPGG